MSTIINFQLIRKQFILNCYMNYSTSSFIYNRIKSKCFKSDPYRLNIRRCNRKYENSSMDDIGISIHPKLMDGLKYNGINSLNELQESIYLSILSGKDVLIHSPIGTGKTISYLIPILNNLYRIHDILDDLLLNSNNNNTINQFHKTLQYNYEKSHSLLSNCTINKPFENNTLNKLINTLSLYKSHDLFKLYPFIPKLPKYLSKKKSIHSIYRFIMTNPLGNLKCTIILVPNKNLVSQIITTIQELDILGRCTLQILTQTHHLPPSNLKHNHHNQSTPPEVTALRSPAESSPNSLPVNGNATPGDRGRSEGGDGSRVKDVTSSGEPAADLREAEGEVNREGHHGEWKTSNGSVEGKERTSSADGKGDIVHHISNDTPSMDDGMKDMLNGVLAYEDIQEMLKNIPRAPISVDKKDYGIDGLVVNDVKYQRQPIIISSNIQWGSVDIVVTTPQLYLNDMLQRKNMGLYPVCMVFDEVDMLMENNSCRSSMMEIISYIRPRPKVYNPLINYYKLKPKEVPPCQLINVASTMMYNGLQTCGSIIHERFSTCKYISSDLNHIIQSGVKYIHVNCNDNKLSILVDVILNNPVPRTIIFTNSIKNLKLLYNTLKNKQWPVLAYHSKSTLTTRIAILKTFFSNEYNGEKSDKITIDENSGGKYEKNGDNAEYCDAKILISTDLLSRGIDVNNVQHIINYDFPNDSSTFLHRIKANNPNTLITCLIEDKNKDLSKQIEYFRKKNKPINELLSRKRSFRRRYNNRMKTITNTNSSSITDTSHYTKSNVGRSPEVETTVPLASTVGPADSSSNYLSLKGKATPRDRGGGEGEDVTSSVASVRGVRTGLSSILSGEDVKYRRLSLKRRLIQYVNV